MCNSLTTWRIENVDCFIRCHIKISSKNKILFDQKHRILFPIKAISANGDYLLLCIYFPPLNSSSVFNI